MKPQGHMLHSHMRPLVMCIHAHFCFNYFGVFFASKGYPFKNIFSIWYSKFNTDVCSTWLSDCTRDIPLAKAHG